ncbi:pilus assembly protein PilM [Candidatus Dependentiae bacterium]
MIREIFLPSQMKGKRYFSESALGISLENDGIHAALIQLTPTGNTLAKVLKYSLSEEEKLELVGKVGWYPKVYLNSLKEIKKLAIHQNIVRVTVPSSLVVIKELELPFCSREKVKMVIEYEAEPLLPFNSDEAFIDFVITSKSEKGKSCRVIVAAIRKSDINKIFEVFDEAEFAPHHIYVDLLATSGLTLQLKATGSEKTSALIEVEKDLIKVVLLENGTLRFVRNIHKGINFFVDALHKTLNISEEECRHKFEHYGFQKSGDKKYDSAIETLSDDLYKDIEFALDSFRLKSDKISEIQSVTVLERGCEIKSFVEQLEHGINLKCKKLSPELLTSKRLLKNKATARYSELYPYLTAIGSAVPPPSHEDFDLGGDFTAHASKSIVKKQLLAGGLLAGLLLFSVGGYGYLQLSSLSNKANSFEQKAIKTFKSVLPKETRLPRKVRLKKIAKDSSQFVEELESAWHSFGCQSIPALEAMLELTRITDKTKFQTIIDKMKVGKDEDGQTVLEVSGTLKTQGERAKLDEFISRFQQAKNLTLVELSEGSYDTSAQTTEFSAKMNVELA